MFRWTWSTFFGLGPEGPIRHHKEIISLLFNYDGKFTWTELWELPRRLRHAYYHMIESQKSDAALEKAKSMQDSNTEPKYDLDKFRQHYQQNSGR